MDQSNLKKQNIKEIPRWLFLLIFSIWCWQVFCWRGDAVKVSHLQIKSILFNLSRQEWLEWGSYCVKYNNTPCAVDVFSRMTVHFPKNRIGLLNLGMASAKLNQCNKALKFLNQYSAFGEEDYESLFWKGKCLQALKKNSLALEALYKSLLLEPKNESTLESLVLFLLDLNRVEESLSILGAIAKGEPNRYPHWRKIQGEIMKKYQRPALELSYQGAKKKASLRLPQLDGKNYWVPIRLHPEAVPEYVLLDLNENETIFSKEKLRYMQSTVQPKRNLASSKERDINNNETKIDFIQFGPWILKDLPIQTCKDCRTTFGRASLESFEVSEIDELGVHFIVLTPL